MGYDVVIVGAGLAGCSTAIFMAERGGRVLLVEKSRYPVHKLCGEFLSPDARRTLQRLGVYEKIQAAGAHTVRRLLLTTISGQRFENDLPAPALGFSRYELDRILLDRARETGVTIQTGVTAREISGNLVNGFTVKTDHEAVTARWVVGAYGKRGRLDRQWNRPFFTTDAPYVAFKMHLEGGSTGDSIEVHALDNGYCGLVGIEGGRTNACCILHRDAIKKTGGKWSALVEQVFSQNQSLYRRITSMTTLWENPISISQVSFARKSLVESDVCMVGDAAGMIAPLCGDGMAIALESGELLAGYLASGLDAKSTNPVVVREYVRAWKRRFLVRFVVGRITQWGFVQPAWAALAVLSFRVFPGLGGQIVRATRGKLD